MTKEKVTGIVLAGGHSRRFGKEKGLVEYLGKPLIEHAVGLFEKFCSDVIISANTKSYDYLGCKVVNDEKINCGPMGGIFSCLKQTKSLANLVLSVDSPLVNEGFYRYVLRCSRGYQVVVPALETELYEPLLGFYRKDVLQVLNSFIRKNNYKLPDFFKEVKLKKLLILHDQDFFHPHLFYNVNTPRDLKLLVEMYIDS